MTAIVASLLVACAAATEGDPCVFESPAAPTPEGRIDKLVLAKLVKLGIQPALCSDAGLPLTEDGLLTDEFYDQKVAECEAAR